MFTLGEVRGCNPNFELFLLQNPRMSSVTNSTVYNRESNGLQDPATCLQEDPVNFLWPIGQEKFKIDCLRKLIPSNDPAHVRGCVSKIPEFRMHLQNFLPAFVGKLLTMFAQAYRSRPINIQWWSHYCRCVCNQLANTLPYPLNTNRFYLAEILSFPHYTPNSYWT